MKVSVLGSGVMGTGIISLLLQSESVTKVVLWGRRSESLDKSYVRVKKEIKRFAKNHDLDPATILGRLQMTENLCKIENSDFCIETVSEDMHIKKEVFLSASTFLSEKSIIATNTSSLSITALSMNYSYPANVVGMHFFNPTSMMELVEIVSGLNTDKLTTDKAVNLANLLGKKTVLVQESPGFIVNRMLIPMINEGISILAEGIASREDIDKAMKLGANHPLGPLSLADLIGNDVCLSIMETLHLETGDPKYRAHPLLRQYVRAGLLGRKTKKGFYHYS